MIYAKRITLIKSDVCHNSAKSTLGINRMKAILTTLGLSSLAILVGCQSIQPYDGKTGYQRQQTSSDQLIISYTLDGKSSNVLTETKLKKACAKELGLASNAPVRINIIDQKEFANLNQAQTINTDNTVRVANTQRTSFGLSSTPKLSNTNNSAKSDLLGSQPATLKQVTFECSKP